MIDRTITSYTILQYFSEKGLSQLDLYIPFHYCPVKAGKSVFEIVET